MPIMESSRDQCNGEEHTYNLHIHLTGEIHVNLQAVALKVKKKKLKLYVYSPTITYLVHALQTLQLTSPDHWI